MRYPHDRYWESLSPTPNAGLQESSDDEKDDDDDDGNDVDYIESGADDSDNEPMAPSFGNTREVNLLFIPSPTLSRHAMPAPSTKGAPSLLPQPPPFEDFLESHLTQKSASPTPAPTPAPAPVPAPQATWRQRIPAPVGTGDPVASVLALLRHNQDLQNALDDAETFINTHQSEINLCNTAREALETQLEVCKIDCVTHLCRADELSRLCGVKEAKIRALEGELANARRQVEQIQEILGCRPSSGEASSGSPSKRARLN
ncbi:hypothetical protein C8J57DRAFT_1509595 [Mycena rebaudengoi]|nr:hypothetical protein C8J57DRAFT_1509595 [Mycena rebaudengoi]